MRQESRSTRASGRFASANGMVEPHLQVSLGIYAEVAEQADASVSKTDVRKDVRVRLPLSAPLRVQTIAHRAGVTDGPDYQWVSSSNCTVSPDYPKKSWRRHDRRNHVRLDHCQHAHAGREDQAVADHAPEDLSLGADLV